MFQGDDEDMLTPEAAAVIFAGELTGPDRFRLECEARTLASWILRHDRSMERALLEPPRDPVPDWPPAHPGEGLAEPGGHRVGLGVEALGGESRAQEAREGPPLDRHGARRAGLSYHRGMPIRFPTMTMDQINAKVLAQGGAAIPRESDRWAEAGPEHIVPERAQSGGLSDAPSGAPKASESGTRPFRLR